MERRWLQSVLVLFFFAASMRAQDRGELIKSVTGSGGLEPAGVSSEFSPADIEKLDIASGLKRYGLAGITAQAWKGHGKGRTVVYEMLDSPAAYGLYTLLRSIRRGESTSTLIGAGSFHRNDKLYFWQSHYVVEIEGSAETQEETAKMFSRNILGRSRKPPVAEYLPPAGVVSGTERYILSAEDVPNTAVIDANALGFDSSAEAVSATYRINGSEAHLLLVLYPTQHIAKKFADVLDAEADSHSFRKRAGPLLAIVRGNDKVIADAILENISHEFKITWSEPKPDLAIGTMIVTIFTFIGIALGVMLVLGLVFGGLRVFLRARYPDRFFERPEAAQLIQLKLIQRVADNSRETANR